MQETVELWLTRFAAQWCMHAPLSRIKAPAAPAVDPLFLAHDPASCCGESRCSSLPLEPAVSWQHI